MARPFWSFYEDLALLFPRDEPRSAGASELSRSASEFSRGGGTWQNRESQGKQGWEWEWALWGLCIYAPHFIWRLQSVVHMCVRVRACKCVSGWHVSCSCSVNSNSVSLSSACWASVLEVDLRHAKSNMSLESSNKSTCVFEHKHACVPACVSAYSCRRRRWGPAGCVLVVWSGALLFS